MKVALTWGEFEEANYVGLRRALQVVHKAHRDDHGKARPHYGAHIDGAVAEKVVSKGLSIYWPAALILNREEGDLVDRRGRKLEVRHTRLDRGGLPLHDEDHDDHVGVLVRGSFPTFEIAGEIDVVAGKNPEWWRGDLDRPCFIVPAHKLAPIDRAA